MLDADDLWDIDKLRAQVDYLTQHPDVLPVDCFMRYISSEGRSLGETGQAIEQDDLRLIGRGEFSPFSISSCRLARRDAVIGAGGFDDSLREAEDLDFLATLARRGRVAWVPQILGS